jgi:hypothetical protein
MVTLALVSELALGRAGRAAARASAGVVLSLDSGRAAAGACPPVFTGAWDGLRLTTR